MGNRQRATIRVWDAATGKLVSQIVRTAYVEAPPVVLDGGRTLVLVESGLNGGESVLGFYETETGGLIREHRSPDLLVNSLAAAPDGSWLAAGGASRVQVWDASEGKLLFTLAGPRYGVDLSVLAVSPDGLQIAAAERHAWGNLAGAVHVWRVADGRRTHKLPAQATALAFTPDSRALVTSGGDGTALVWDLSATAPGPVPQADLTDAELEQRWTAVAGGHVWHLGNEGNYARIEAMAEQGDRSVAFLESRLLDANLAAKDEAQIERLIAPLSDPDPSVRDRAAEGLAIFNDHLTPHVTKDQATAVLVQQEMRQMLRQMLRERRDETVYKVLSQIGTLRARWLLHRLADGLPDNEENRLRKSNARKTAEALDRARLRIPGQPAEKPPGSRNTPPPQ